MGSDLHGFVEVRSGKTWKPLINLGPLITRNYDFFGMVFGERNYTGFPPLAEDRGLPPDVSASVHKAAAPAGYYGHTWIGYDEIVSINWDEQSVIPDRRMHHYRVQGDGSLVFVGKSGFDSHLYRLMTSGQSTNVEITVGMEVRDGNDVYRAECLTRRDILDDNPTWKCLFDLLDSCICHYCPAAYFRFVVWFDC